ncbi:MAG: tetratricopeptide repeat protein [Planctomycetota bacterium]|nr:tetratricopeptide repeat protein [Planctomycetota bacterium]
MNREQTTIRTNLLHGIRLNLALAALALLTGCRDQPPAPKTPQETGRHIDSTEPVATPPLNDSLTAHFNLIEAKRTGTARIRIRQWLNEHPEDPRAEFLMGLSHHRDRRYARALTWFQDAIQHEPVYPPAWHFLGWAHYYLGNAQSARHAFEEHLVMDPSEGDSHFALGLQDLEAWQLDEAEQNFRKAIQLQSALPNRVKGVSKATARLSEVIETRDGNIDEAITLLKESVRLYPDHYEAWYRLSQLLQQQGRVEEAEDAQRSFLEARERVRPKGGAFE